VTGIEDLGIDLDLGKWVAVIAEALYRAVYQMLLSAHSRTGLFLYHRRGVFWSRL
jgi:hypothetical protein